MRTGWVPHRKLRDLRRHAAPSRTPSGAALALLIGCGIAAMTPANAQTLPEVEKQVESDAKKDYPAESYSEAVRKEGLKRAEEVSKSLKPDEAKIQFAIGNFFGFYFVNVRSHVTYCRNLGVDISAFTKAFEAANEEMHVQASKLLYRRGATEEQLFKQMEPSLASMTGKNMDDLAATDKLTTRQECELQLQNLEARVARVNFAKIQPDIAKILLSAQ
jgi:hypothetical protein